MNQSDLKQQIHRTEQQLRRTKKQLTVLNAITSFIEDLIVVLSVLAIVGIFGGVERGTIAAWKLVPAIILVVIVNVGFKLMASWAKD